MEELLKILHDLIRAEKLDAFNSPKGFIEIDEKAWFELIKTSVDYNSPICLSSLLEENRVSKESLTPLIEDAFSADILKILKDQGVDVFSFDREQKENYFKCESGRPLKICKRELLEEGEVKEGKSNPEIAQSNFYSEMILTNACPFKVNKQIPNEIFEPSNEKGKKHKLLWTNDRLGQLTLELNDGRVLAIGGEHEDFYDPHFCIFNDIIVHEANGDKKVLLYPYDVFPPTDFHTGTLIDDKVYIIGRMGYDIPEDGSKPVYIIDINTYEIQELKIKNTIDGCVNSHKAERVENGIIISGGRVLRLKGEMESFTEKYLLDLNQLMWVKV